MSHGKEEDRNSNINRRKFIGAGLAIGGVAAALAGAAEGLPAFASGAPASKTDELEEATIAELQEGMRGGKWSARELAEKYIERIERFDRKGPALNSVIELNPDALSLAAALDRERKAGRETWWYTMVEPKYPYPTWLLDDDAAVQRVL